MANEGRFRRDLYFRLAVVTIEVPSLNERREDISLLANYFLDRFSKKFRKSFSGLAPDAVHALEHFHWAGNVRELRNVIERAVLLGKGNLLSATQLGLEISTDPSFTLC